MAEPNRESKEVKKGGKTGCIVGGVIALIILILLLAYGYWWV